MAIYKYVTPERIDVFVNGRIRFTQAAVLNDPFELQPHFDSLAPTSVLLKNIEQLDLTPHLLEAYDSVSPEIKSRASKDKFLELARRALNSERGRRAAYEGIATVLAALPAMASQARDIIGSGLRERFGILSLTESPDNLLMWSHYAASHSGFILEFDERHEFFNRRRSPNDELYWLRPVEYRDPAPNVSLQEFDGAPLLVTKRSEWAYEREWRMLAPVEQAIEVLDHPQGKIHLFDLPPRAITGIILGARLAPDIADKLRALIGFDARYRHVSIRQALLNTASGTVTIQ